jgi:hypothetical protein
MNIKTIKLLTDIKMLIEDVALYDEPAFMKALSEKTEKLCAILKEKEWDVEDRMINASFVEQ